jgi:hypothetical protein
VAVLVALDPTRARQVPAHCSSTQDRQEERAKQSLARLHESRKPILSLHKSGISVMIMLILTGLIDLTVRAWTDRFESGARVAIRPVPRRRSRVPGTGSARFKKPASSAIIDHRGGQLKMDFFSWNRAAMGQLTAQDDGIRRSLRSVGNALCFSATCGYALG